LLLLDHIPLDPYFVTVLEPNVLIDVSVFDQESSDLRQR
jgi:hypothetical protein